MNFCWPGKTLIRIIGKQVLDMVTLRANTFLKNILCCIAPYIFLLSKF